MSWRRLRTLLVREARATWRDPFTMTILVMVPLFALAAFGFVLSTEVKQLGLGVLDASASRESRRILSALEANGTFAIERFDTRASLDRALVSGEISSAVVVPADFAKSVHAPGAPDEGAQIEVIYDGGETVLAGNAEGFLRSLVSAVQLEASPGLRAAPNSGVAVRTRALFNPTLDGTRFMVAGTFGFVLSFLTTLITAVSIVNERLGGTFEQLQITPATSLEIFLGKLLPLGAVFALDVVLMVLAAGFVLGTWPAGNVIFFVAVSSFYVLVSLALGLVISATSASAAEAVQKTVILSIPLTQLSGFAFPLRNMPTPVRWAAELFPATHYIRISRAIYLRGEGPLSLISELALLGIFAGLLIAFALRTLERRA